MSSSEFPRFDAAARLPISSARSKTPTASSNRPSRCSTMPCIFTASSKSAFRASAHRIHSRAPATSRSAARNWHHATSVSTWFGLSASARRRSASAASGLFCPAPAAPGSPIPKSGRAATPPRVRSAASASVSRPSSRSKEPRLIHAAAKSGRNASARRYRFSALLVCPNRASANPAANSASGSPGRKRQRRFITLQRLFIPSRQRKRVPQSQLRCHKGWPPLAAPAQTPSIASVRPPHRNLQLTQSHPRQRIHSVQPDRLRIRAFCFFHPPSGLERLPQHHPRRAHPRRRCHSGGSPSSPRLLSAGCSAPPGSCPPVLPAAAGFASGPAGSTAQF